MSKKKTTKKKSATNPKPSAKKSTKTKAKVKKSTGPDKNPVKSKIVVGFKTVSLDMHAWHDPNYVYTLGAEHEIKYNTEDEKRIGDACGKGLHFSPTEKKTYQYTHNKENFLVLEVQANESDILGKDSEKFRVSKLKVNKVLKTVTRYGDEWKAAEKEVVALPKVFLQPQKDITPKSVTAAVTAYGKASGIKSIKCHIVENVYEAHAIISHLGNSWYASNGVSASVPDMPTFSNKILRPGSMDAAVRNIASIYLSHRETSIKNYPPSKSEIAMNDAAFSLLKMGCLPLGYDANKKTMVVWVPKENPFTAKSPY